MPAFQPIWIWGFITFQIAPFNVHEMFRETGTDYAAKDVITPTSAGEFGLFQAKPREWVGRGDERIRFSGVSFPQRVISNGGDQIRLGGPIPQLSNLDGPTAVELEALNHRAYRLVRGNGEAYGYYFCERLLEHETDFNRQGSPRVKEYEIHFVRAADYQGSQNNPAISFAIAAGNIA